MSYDRPLTGPTTQYNKGFLDGVAWERQRALGLQSAIVKEIVFWLRYGAEGPIEQKDGKPVNDHRARNGLLWLMANMIEARFL